MSQSSHPSTIVGWREWVCLPGIDVPWIKAKLDTGARSSSLHASQIELLPGDLDRVRFRVEPWQDSVQDAAVHECAVLDRRIVRSSSGHADERFVVLMEVVLSGRHITAEVTLADRDEMGFRMLIGREALRQGFVVDSTRSFLGPRAPRQVRRRNRNRGAPAG